jgi:predicted transcriptional regulator
MPRHTENPGAKERAATRRVRALELRIQGQPFRAIGRELGVSHARVVQYVQQSLAALAAQEQAHAQAQRQLDLERIDRALAGVMPKAEAGDAAAVQSLCRLLERRAKLLGLDAPTRSVVAGDPEAPITVAAVSQLSDEERAARIEAILDRAKSRQDSLPLLTYREGVRCADAAEGVDNG